MKPKYILFFFLLSFALSETSIAQEGRKRKFEIILGPQIASGQWPRGKGATFPPGMTKRANAGPGAYLQIAKRRSSNAKVKISTGMSLSWYAYTLHYNYPDNYNLAHTVEDKFNYFFASIDNSLQFRVLNKKKVQIFSCAGLSANMLLSSKMKSTVDMISFSFTGNSSLTKYEDRLNLTYSLGIKMVLASQSNHPISIAPGYTHFLKEQFLPSPPGRVIRAFRMGIGYGF